MLCRFMLHYVTLRYVCMNLCMCMYVCACRSVRARICEYIFVFRFASSKANLARLQQAVRETGQRERVIAECNAKLLHLARARREAKLQAVKAAAVEPGVRVTYTLAELTCRPPWPEGVEPRSRERWLSEEDFQSTFGMDLQAWDMLPQWKRTQMKKQKALF